MSVRWESCFLLCQEQWWKRHLQGIPQKLQNPWLQCLKTGWPRLTQLRHMKKGDKRTRLPSSQPVKFLQTVCLFIHHFQIDLNSPCLPPKLLKTNVACPGYFQEKVKTMVIAKVPYGHVKMMNWIVFMHICLIILSIASVSYYYYVIHACTSSHLLLYTLFDTLVFVYHLLKFQVQ